MGQAGVANATPCAAGNGKTGGGGQTGTVCPARRRPISVHHSPPAHKTHRRHLAAVRRGDRRSDRLRQVPGPQVRPMVPSKHREKRPPVLLPRLPDARMAGTATLVRPTTPRASPFPQYPAATADLGAQLDLGVLRSARISLGWPKAPHYLQHDLFVSTGIWIVLDKGQFYSEESALVLPKNDHIAQ